MTYDQVHHVCLQSQYEEYSTIWSRFWCRRGPARRMYAGSLLGPSLVRTSLQWATAPNAFACRDYVRFLHIPSRNHPRANGIPHKSSSLRPTRASPIFHSCFSADISWRTHQPDSCNRNGGYGPLLQQKSPPQVLPRVYCNHRWNDSVRWRVFPLLGLPSIAILASFEDRSRAVYTTGGFGIRRLVGSRGTDSLVSIRNSTSSDAGGWYHEAW